jgi:hypothetical protein
MEVLNYDRNKTKYERLKISGYCRSVRKKVKIRMNEENVVKKRKATGRRCNGWKTETLLCLVIAVDWEVGITLSKLINS